jgi:hypothetical protein
MAVRRGRLLGALVAVDAAGALVAARHGVAGEPFGFGGSFDVRRPSVLVLWGSALSAPGLGLAGAVLAGRRAPGAVRVAGAVFAVGAMSEPAFWGRRPCPWYGRVLLWVHVSLGVVLALAPMGDAPARSDRPLAAGG